MLALMCVPEADNAEFPLQTSIV